MSRIDEAFINVYADRAANAEAAVASTPQPKKRSGPHFQVQQPAHSLRLFFQQEEDEPRKLATQSREGRVDAPHVHNRKGDSCDAHRGCAECASMESHVIELSSTYPVGNHGAPEAVERRPLSSFAAPVSASEAFHPAFEVDAYRWPPITEQFCRARRELLQPVVELLVSGAREGRAMVGLAGTRPGVGTSTVAMCLARLLAASGKNVALVDANFALGNLAPNLGLEFDAGWEDALRGMLPLAECVVHAIEDRVSLVPLKGPVPASRELLAGIQTSVVAGVLRCHYDLVLFDLGAPSDSVNWSAAESVVNFCRLDAGIVVAQSAETQSEVGSDMARITGLFGPACLGVIGNSTA